MSWADIKATARRAVHDTFQYAGTYTPPSGSAVPVVVRVLRQDEMYGNYDGIGYADRATAAYRIVFLLEEVSDPVYGGVVTLDDSGAQYHIENVLLPDDPYIFCEASEV